MRYLNACALFVIVWFVCFSIVCESEELQPAESDAQSAFEKLKSLQGVWEAKTPKEESTQSPAFQGNIHITYGILLAVSVGALTPAQAQSATDPYKLDRTGAPDSRTGVSGKHHPGC